VSERNQRQIATGAILILIGLGLFALQFLEGFGEAVIFFLIGGAFVAAYLYFRNYGLLIPGGILLGLGLGSVGKGSVLAFGDFDAIGLGVGFVAIYVIALVYEGRSHWWPLIPGLILIVTGLASGTSFERLLSVGWPLILIFLGLLLLAGAFGLVGRRRDAD
jgi:hypothetical protein